MYEFIEEAGNEHGVVRAVLALGRLSRQRKEIGKMAHRLTCRILLALETMGGRRRDTAEEIGILSS
jgi:hypothetical protein